MATRIIPRKGTKPAIGGTKSGTLGAVPLDTGRPVTELFGLEAAVLDGFAAARHERPASAASEVLRIAALPR